MGYRYLTVQEVDYAMKDQPVLEWVTTSYIRFCACVCVCVFVPPEISETGDHITLLVILSWRGSSGMLHKLLFKLTRCWVWEKKPLKRFHQLHAESRTRTVTFPVTLGRMNLADYNKAIGTFLNGTHWSTHPPHYGCQSCYCFVREWAIDTSQCEKLITGTR